MNEKMRVNVTKETFITPIINHLFMHPRHGYFTIIPLCAILLILYIPLFSGIIQREGTNEQKLEQLPPRAALTPHQLIAITGDSQMASFTNKTGTGTSNDPYIIQGYSIDASGASGFYVYGISIVSVSYYVVIRNCSVFKASGTYGGYSIYISSTPNILIENCTAYSSPFGIYIGNCANATVRNCTIFKATTVGVHCVSSTNSLIEDNWINNTYKGVYIYSQSSQAQRNIVRYCNFGFDVYYYSSLLFNNTIFNCSKAVSFGNSNINVTSNIIINNTVAFDFWDTQNPQNNRIWFNYIADNINNWYTGTYAQFSYWDNGSHGNYWDDYTSRYPSATQTNGIWNTPYQIKDHSKYDSYPLAFPFWDDIYIPEEEEEPPPDEEEPPPEDGADNGVDEKETDEFTAVETAMIIVAAGFGIGLIGVGYISYLRTTNCVPPKGKWYCKGLLE